jgi:DMSO/TMAO reductase YedYZ molybdopterin-dependent catalytic subunit
VKAWQYGAFAGISAGAVALGVAEVVAVATGPRSAPLVAVGGVVVDRVPEPVKAFAIDVFYTYDKVALLVGTLLLVMLFAAVIGVLAMRRLWAGLVGLAVFAGIGVAAALTRHEAGWTAALPSLIGAVAGAGVLVALVRLRPQPSTGPSEDEVGRVHQEVVAAGHRRWFLRIAGGGLAASVVLGFAGRWLASRRGVAKERAAVTLPQPASPASPLPAEVDQKLPRLAPFVTNNDDFYLIDTALVVPQVSPEDWTLRIHGRVRKPVVLTYEQLLARPMIERYITLACVSNEVGGGLIGNALWLGVPLKDILDEVEPEPGADQVVSRSVDGYNAGTPTAVLRDGRDAMLAIGMNGVPLPIDHGFPVRMVVPGLYGYVSATKWLAELELTSFADFDAYWVRRGWSAQGPIKTQSRIDTPLHGANPQAGPIMLAGVAWAQQRGVSKVEVQVDDDPWQEARLAAVPSIDTWRQWTWLWNATPGKHRLRVRATDNGGATQTDAEAPPVPDGATGWHTIDVEVG